MQIGVDFFTVNMSYTMIQHIFSKMFVSELAPWCCPQASPKDPTKIFPQILHPGLQNRSQTIVLTPRHLMAAPKTTINDVFGILNAVN
jgi:hypothetical protein